MSKPVESRTHKEQATRSRAGNKRIPVGHPDRDHRRTTAALRSAEPLTPAQRIAALDARLGVGVGAAKERARLAAYGG